MALLEIIDRRLGSQPGRAARPAVLVLDNGPIHTSRLTTKALAARPWLTVERLPTYAPELNDIELAWRDLKRHRLAHRTFVDAEHLETSIRRSLIDMNRERMKPLRVTARELLLRRLLQRAYQGISCPVDICFWASSTHTSRLVDC